MCGLWNPRVADEIDIEAIAVPPRPAPKCDIPEKPKRNTIAGGRASRARFTKEERRARTAPTSRSNIARFNAARGVTMWHRIAMAMQPGEWCAVPDVWKRIPNVRKPVISDRMALMCKSGILERHEIPGWAPRRTVNAASGKEMWWKPAKWLYRLTPKGEGYARTGLVRKWLE